MSSFLEASERLSEEGFFRIDNTPVPPATQLQTLLLKYTTTPKICTKKSKLQDLLQRTDAKQRMVLLNTVTDEAGKTILHCAAERNHCKTIQSVLNVLQKEERLELLLKVDNEGRTALHCSATQGNKAPITCMLQSLELSDWQMRFLLVKTIEGKSALDMAVGRHGADAFRELKKWVGSVEARLNIREVVIDERKHDPGDDIWALEIRVQNQCQSYKKIVAEYRTQLDHSIHFSLEVVRDYRCKMNILTDYLAELTMDVAECIDNIERNADINEPCKATLLGRLEKIQQKLGQIQREMEVLSKELKSKYESALQAQKIAELEALLRGHEVNLADQSTRIDVIESDVSMVREVQQGHGQRLTDAEREIESLSYSPGGFQPIDEDEISLVTASQETSSNVSY